jgi:preprotein translocase SecE subunit
MANQKAPSSGKVVIAFLHQVREELRHVTWPNKDRVIKLTLMVIGISFAAGLYLGGLDYLFTLLMGVII